MPVDCLCFNKNIGFSGRSRIVLNYFSADFKPKYSSKYGWCLSNFWSRRADIIKSVMTHITICRNVFSIEQTTRAVFVAFCLDFPFRERNNFIRFS